MAGNSSGYAMFLGCVIPNLLPHLEISIRKVFSRLDVEVKDIPGFSCCPEPIGIPGLDITTWVALAARNLCVAEEAGLDIITFCNGCFETLKEAKVLLEHDAKLRSKVAEALSKIGREYKGRVEVKHFAQVLYEDVGPAKLRSYVEKPLKGVKVAAHYGCHILRPSHLLQVDDPFNPVLLDVLVEATGAESVDYFRKFLCCGCGVGNLDENTNVRMVMEKLYYMTQAKADCMVVLCPVCFRQYDVRQMIINKTYGTNYNIPVLYYTQLLGLAMGMTPDELELKSNRTKVDPLLAKIEGKV